jgi:hypothetical protein
VWCFKLTACCSYLIGQYGQLLDSQLSVVDVIKLKARIVSRDEIWVSRHGYFEITKLGVLSEVEYNLNLLNYIRQRRLMQLQEDHVSHTKFQRLTQHRDEFIAPSAPHIPRVSDD